MLLKEITWLVHETSKLFFTVWMEAQRQANGNAIADSGQKPMLDKSQQYAWIRTGSLSAPGVKSTNNNQPLKSLLWDLDLGPYLNILIYRNSSFSFCLFAIFLVCTLDGNLRLTKTTCSRNGTGPLSSSCFETQIGCGNNLHLQQKLGIQANAVYFDLYHAYPCIHFIIVMTRNL